MQKSYQSGRPAQQVVNIRGRKLDESLRQIVLERFA
jgi:hypothetical protein